MIRSHLKQWLFVICSLLVITGGIIVGNCTAKAGNQIQIFADTITAESNGYVSIPIKIKDNSGLMGFELKAEYDAATLEVVNINKGIMLNGVFGSNIDNSNGTATVSWSGVSEVSENGTVFWIDCKVNNKSNAQNESVIHISSLKKDSFDEQYQDVNISCQDIRVDISKVNINEDAGQTISIYADKITAEPGKDIKVPIMIKNNSGLMGLVLEMQYDASVIEPKEIAAGDIIPSGTIFDNNIGVKDGLLKVLWSGTSEMTDNGQLFSIVLNIKQTTKMENVKIKLTYNQSDTFDGKYQQAYISTQDIDIVLKSSDDSENTSVPTDSPGSNETPKPNETVRPEETKEPDLDKTLQNPSPAATPSVTQESNSQINQEDKSEQLLDSSYKMPALSKVAVKSFKKKGSKGLFLKWEKSKSAQITGYEIQYSLKRKFKTKKKIIVSKNKTYLHISKVKKNKKYYVRVRSYYKYTMSNGRKKCIYSKWSNVKSCNS